MLPLGIFLADAVITSVAAWLLVRADRHAGRGFLEAFLAWSWSFVALITGAGVVLGIAGGFGAAGFLALHGAVLAALALTRRRTLATDFKSLRLTGSQLREFLNTPGPARLLALGVIVILTALAVIAALAESAVVDALTYHLPRVGHWLQAGEIGIIPGPDTRLNFVAVLPDIVMAWLVGVGREGFPLLVLTQAIGGIMT
ncbi:MAG: hypothetical protein H7343_17990, partial [Undibacterium sp.]|nr:hypothetical protein [Opitutaceae bacterium]